jgi:hypothetical protein
MDLARCCGQSDPYANTSDPARIQPFFWKPSDLLVEHPNRDFGAGNLRYWERHEAGHLLASPGHSVDPEVVALKIADLNQHYRIRGLAYDRWRIEDLLREFDHVGLATYRDKIAERDAAPRQREIGLRPVPWGQGFKDVAPGVDVIHAGHRRPQAGTRTTQC